MKKSWLMPFENCSSPIKKTLMPDWMDKNTPAWVNSRNLSTQRDVSHIACCYNTVSQKHNSHLQTFQKLPDRTSLGETWRLFGTYSGTPDGSWPTGTGCAVTCRSGFWGSTVMSRPFSYLLQRLGILRQRMWLWPSRILLSMSLANRRGVIRS